MATFLGVDCGATNLRFGIVDENGKVLASKKLPSPLRHQPERLARIVKDQIGAQEIDGIGLGVPGPLDLKKGLILVSSNLGNIAPIPVRAKFESVFSQKIYLDRDTIVGLIGEAWVGVAKGCKNVVMLTLGTGIGGAIMVDGEIERGEGMAGEIGHMYLSVIPGPSAVSSGQSNCSDPESIPKCGLGHEGCFEAMINSAKDLDELVTYLGYGLSNIVDIFNPEKIIIGGGKAIHQLVDRNFLLNAIKIMKKTGIKPAVDMVRVEYAKLGEWSGIVGAAKGAYDCNQNP